MTQKTIISLIILTLAFPTAAFAMFAATSSPDAVSTGATTTEASTSATASSTEPVSKTEAELIIEEIAELEDAYYGIHGRYLQVMRNNVLPHYESGSVAEKLGKNIAADAHVDVYDGPRGRGYGPEAARWTAAPRTVYTASAVASSTDER
jgi:hypothetical protein